MAAVKEYVKSLADFILNLETTPLKSLEVSACPTTLDMLRYMRFYVDAEDEDESHDGDQEFVLTAEIFDSHWLAYSKSPNILLCSADEDS